MGVDHPNGWSEDLAWNRKSPDGPYFDELWNQWFTLEAMYAGDDYHPLWPPYVFGSIRTLS